MPVGHPAASLVWQPGTGWQSCLPPNDAAGALLDLYLPICSATAARPITVGHLGQSLDGFIATHAGESQFVTGQENILHLHRMRALCDAVVVGAGTVAADDPQLTTRHVAGPNPLRVVFDPSAAAVGRLPRLQRRRGADTCTSARDRCVGPGETHFGRAAIVARRRRRRPASTWPRCCGCCASGAAARIFVEGGGVTVSMFLEANLLDRLQMAIAPLIIGDGRPAIRLPPRATLSDCHRPRYRVFRMGGDVLFDCDLRHRRRPGRPGGPTTAVTRVDLILK